MTKQQLIDQITEMNRSARAEFLAEFSEAELQQYLGNLETIWAGFQSQFSQAAAEPWAETDNTPAPPAELATTG